MTLRMASIIKIVTLHDEPPNFSGMVTIRIELSTPPETKSLDDGLKRSAVIGNS